MEFEVIQPVTQDHDSTDDELPAPKRRRGVGKEWHVDKTFPDKDAAIAFVKVRVVVVQKDDYDEMIMMMGEAEHDDDDDDYTASLIDCPPPVTGVAAGKWSCPVSGCVCGTRVPDHLQNRSHPAVSMMFMRIIDDWW